MSHPAPRFPKPCMLLTDLAERTGVHQADKLLFSPANILQIGLGEYLRSIVITGSKAG
jgi:hypothetical protein